MNAVSEAAAIRELTTRPAGLLAIAVIGVKSLTMSNDAFLFWMRSMVCASEMTTPMVVPSGAERLSMFMPIEPDAPAWFSTTTGWRRLSLNFRPTSRALMSPAPPGGLGTMMRIGRNGRSCAVAASGSSANARSTRAGHGLGLSCSLSRLGRSEKPGAPTLHLLILERPFAVAQPRHHALLMQGVELEGDFAPVRAAERLHDLIEEHRPGFQRLARIVVAPLRLETRRPRPPGFDRIGNAVRGGQIEACLVDQSVLVPGRVHVEAGIAGRDHDIGRRSEAGRHGPLHLLLGKNVDVIVHDEDVLYPGDVMECRDRVSRLAALPPAQCDAHVLPSVRCRHAQQCGGLDAGGAQDLPNLQLGIEPAEIA